MTSPPASHLYNYAQRMQATKVTVLELLAATQAGRSRRRSSTRAGSTPCSRSRWATGAVADQGAARRCRHWQATPRCDGPFAVIACPSPNLNAYRDTLALQQKTHCNPKVNVDLPVPVLEPYFARAGAACAGSRAGVRRGAAASVRWSAT